METRSKAQGKPLKKPGAYDTDAYYAEADAGFGDVGVDQEPDAGKTQADNTAADPNFEVSREEDQAASAGADEGLEDADVGAEEDVADLKAGAAEDVPDVNRRDGMPIDVQDVSREELESQEAFVVPP